MTELYKLWRWMFLGQVQSISAMSDRSTNLCPSQATAIIVQALQTVIQLPIRRMAFEGRGRHIWLAIAFMGTVEIYQLGKP